MHGLNCCRTIGFVLALWSTAISQTIVNAQTSPGSALDRTGRTRLTSGRPLQIAMENVALQKSHGLVNSVKLAPLAERSIAGGKAAVSPVVTAVAVSPDNTILIAAGDDHAIRILDIVTLETKLVLQGHRDWVQSIDFAPNGNSFVSCGNDRELWLWENGPNWKGRRLLINEFALNVAVFSPDSQSIAFAGFGKAINIWSMTKQAVVQTLTSSCEDYRALTFSHDGNQLAAGGRDKHLRIWDWRSGQLTHEAELHKDRIRSVNFQSDDAIVTTIGQDRRIVRYDLRSQQKILDVQLTGGKLTAMTPIDDQMVAVAGSDNSIRFFCLIENVEKSKLDDHLGTVAVLKRAGQWLISSGYDTELRVWDIPFCLEHPRLPATSDTVTDRILPKTVLPTSTR